MEVSLGNPVVTSFDECIVCFGPFVSRKFLARCRLLEHKVRKAFDGVALVAADIVNFSWSKMHHQGAESSNRVVDVGR